MVLLWAQMVCITIKVKIDSYILMQCCSNHHASDRNGSSRTRLCLLYCTTRVMTADTSHRPVSCCNQYFGLKGVVDVFSESDWQGRFKLHQGWAHQVFVPSILTLISALLSVFESAFLQSSVMHIFLSDFSNMTRSFQQMWRCRNSDIMSRNCWFRRRLWVIWAEIKSIRF